MSNKSMNCAECNIPDVNCYEQCRNCMGATFGDCDICDRRRKEGSHGLQKGRKEEEIGGNTDE